MRRGLALLCLLASLILLIASQLGSCGSVEESIIGSCRDIPGQEHSCKDYLGKQKADPASLCAVDGGTFDTAPCPTTDVKATCTYDIAGSKVRWTFYEEYIHSTDIIRQSCEIAGGRYDGIDQ
ncbi:MAG: hypothetical protein JXR96_10410 [Deltaproteobacteria bacterium]|nr:hypothetical protein [Deltaproteobacteria bacterium]